MGSLIESRAHAVPVAFVEVVTLGHSLAKRDADIRAYFDRRGPSRVPHRSDQRSP